LRSGEEVDVGLRGIEILGQALVSLAADGGKGQVPAKAERAIAGAGVVGQRELRAEAGAAGTGCQGHRQRPRAGDRVGGEFLANSPDSTTTLGKRNRRAGEIGFLFAASSGLLLSNHKRLPSVLNWLWRYRIV